MHCVDLGESFPTSIHVHNLASIQPITSLVKFARSPRTDLPGLQCCWAFAARPRHLLPGPPEAGDQQVPQLFQARAADPRRRDRPHTSGHGRDRPRDRKPLRDGWELSWI